MPTTADGRACLGRPLPMHVCLRAGMCAGAWAGPCRRGRVGAGGRQQRSRATSGRPVAVHLTFGVCGPGRRPFPPGCRAHSRGRGRRARPRARTTCAAGRGTWTARPVPRVGFSLFHARHHLFRAEARARSPCGTVLIRDLANFDPGLGHFFLTRAKQGTRAGGSPRAVPGERMGIGGGEGRIETTKG